jgi:ribonuclease HI
MQRAQQAINISVQWAEDYGVEFSVKKTVVMICTRKTLTDLPPPLTLYGEQIPFSNTAKYLGVTLDSKLTWKPHLELKIKAAKRALMATRSYLSKTWGPSPKCARWSWTGVVRPALTYGCVVWAKACTTKTQINTLTKLQRLALMQVAHVRKGTPTAALEIMYGVPPLDLFITEMALKATTRIPCDEIWQPRVRLRQKVVIGHMRFLELSAPERFWALKYDECSPEYLWEQNYTIDLSPANMCPHGDYDAYTDGSLMNGRTGAGGFLYKNRSHFCSFRSNVGESTVFQAEMVAIKSAALILLNNNVQDRTIIFHIDNQATIKSLNKPTIDKKSTLSTKQVLNTLGSRNCVTLAWVKAHSGILGNEGADNMAKRGGLCDVLYQVPDVQMFKS